ncbi:hypothetical protein Glove_104g27 [Diversispora epigaea]|uniref:CENP-C homolog n=1 Tax=Diversispora epigaea TaxID=1348612 RepID=A0A397J333_9GLOM|nr:hypothetical protein Glove_104g27 [Diversispora epigaea]
METDKKCKGRPNKFTEIGLRGRKTGVAASQEVLKDLNGLDNIDSFFASVINSEGLNNSNNDTERASMSSMSLVNSSQGSQDPQQNMTTFSHNEDSQKTSLFSNLLPSISTNNEGIHKKNSLIVDSQPNKLPYISLTSIDNEDSQPNKLRHSSHIIDNEDYVSNLNDLYDELEQSDFELNGGPSKKIPREDIITLDDREVTHSNDNHESSPLQPAQGADVVPALIRDDEYKEDSAGSEIVRDDPNVPIINELSKPSKPPKYKRKKERVKLIATVDDDLYMTFKTITIPSKDGENSGNSTKQDNEGNKKSGGGKKASKPRNPQPFKASRYNSVRNINNARKSNKNDKEPLHVESDNEIDEQPSDDDAKKNKNTSRKRNRTTDSDSDSEKDRDDREENAHSSQSSKNRTIRSFLGGVSRNEVIENEEGGLRRSKRQRVKPLEFWRNERLVYRPHKTEIVRIPNKDTDTEPKKRKRDESKNNTKRSTLRKEDSDDTITNNKAKYEGEVNVWGTNDKISTQLVYESNMIKPSLIENNEYKHAKTFGEGDFFTSGFIAIPKGCEKPIKNSNASALVFVVMKGPVIFTIDEKSFVVKEGGEFFVPRGNDYGIKNSGRCEARLFYAQAQV